MAAGVAKNLISAARVSIVTVLYLSCVTVLVTARVGYSISVLFKYWTPWLFMTVATLASNVFRVLSHMTQLSRLSRYYHIHFPSSSMHSPPSFALSSHPALSMEHYPRDAHVKPRHELNALLEKCSICFDSRLEFCLSYCRDQFCRDCFQRYVKEVVSSSWGLSVTKIRCPVCQVSIPQAEWSQLVDPSIIEKYNQFNRPYRSFSRCCPHCEQEMTACERDHNDDSSSRLKFSGSSRASHIQDMIKGLLQSGRCYQSSDAICKAMQNVCKKFEQQCWRSSSFVDLYRHTMNTLIEFTQRHPDPLAVTKTYAVSRQILMLDIKPETWKRLQFAHISYFPNIECSQCHLSFCLQCGYESHPRVSCEDNMQAMLDTDRWTTDAIQTLQWKLEHSRRCPNCSIMINRDEGCNKVDCSLCGFCFCWSCRSPWSEKCGFFRCAVTGTTDDDMLRSKLQAETSKTELGVPNIPAIQSRLFGRVDLGTG